MESKNMKKISVIIPVYNRQKYIEKCLDSIIAQTYKNTEIICVDDCSTDNSLSVLREYKNKDSRIKVFPLKKNSGVSNARNTGIKNATGEFLLFVDSDDTIDKNMLTEMMEIESETDADVILSDLEMVENGKAKNMRISIAPRQLYGKEEIRNSILPRFTFEGADNLGLFSFSTKLYKRSIIDDNNILFDTSIAYEEDKLFVIEVIANCNSLYYVPKAYYKYDTSSGGLYSSFNKDSWVWYVNGYKKFISLIKKYEIANTNTKYLADSFIYNISWFLYRSQRIKSRREKKNIQNRVIKDKDVRKICIDTLDMLESFDKRISKAVIKGNRFFAMTLINFVYSGKKDKLLKLLKRQ